jgi:alpha-tubulin suppressor-like RCC1 family protein
LGNGGTAYRTIPGPVVMTGVFAGKTLTMIAAGSSHGLGLCSDGTLGAWGTNSPGSTPGAIHGTGALAGKTVVAIAAGGYHSLGLGADGALTAWGNNSYGQLGDGSQAYSYAPVAVVQNGALVGRRVVAIAAGSSHNLALCADGTLVAWGDNTAGQLGDGTGVASNVPVAVNQTGVLAGKTIVAIACGNAHSLALTADGMIAAWGNNGTGALGTGNTNNSNVPVQVDQTGVLAG